MREVRSCSQVRTVICGESSLQSYVSYRWDLDLIGCYMADEVERLKKEKEDNQFKIDNFENASKRLENLKQHEFEGYKDVFVGFVGRHFNGNLSMIELDQEYLFLGDPVNRGGYEETENAMSRYGKLQSTARQSFSRTTAPVSDARSFNTAVPSVNVAKPRTNAFQKLHSPLRRPFYQQTTLKNRNLNNKVNTAKVISINTVKGKRMTSTVGEQGINDVKPTSYWAWRPKIKMINHVYKNIRSCISLATPGQTATGKESLNPCMAGSLAKTIRVSCSDSNNVDEESQKFGRKAKVMISDAEEYLISEDPVKQGRMEETENA
ncbi:hypothetical protein Tco_0273550 [Tanacetum coccineum]